MKSKNTKFLSIDYIIEFSPCFKVGHHKIKLIFRFLNDKMNLRLDCF